MAQDPNHLVWLDMEMTGLDPDRDRVIEVAMIVTDGDLNEVAQSPVWVIHQPDAVLDAMDEWNKNTHGKSGLLDRVRASTHDEVTASSEILAFLVEWSPRRGSPMCGNSICQDRRFMARHLPAVEDWFHYRNLDVSTLKELCRRWRPALAKGVVKKGAHTALADIQESIEEMRYYRQHFLRLEDV